MHGWTFCNRRVGCGARTACTNYVKGLPLRPAAVSSSSPQVLPVLGFGPFGPSCTEDGRFPFRDCAALKAPSNWVVYGEGGDAWWPGQQQLGEGGWGVIREHHKWCCAVKPGHFLQQA